MKSDNFKALQEVPNVATDNVLRGQHRVLRAIIIQQWINYEFFSAVPENITL
jgi:hypothetical protein